MPNLTAKYLQAVDQHKLIADNYQINAAHALDDFLGQWQAYGLLQPWQRWFKKVPAGLYLYGPVGRGKTMLLDWVYNEANGAKQRYHFNKLMLDVHSKIFENPKLPLAEIAALILKPRSLLCLDEFYVTDVADAMILQPLVQAWLQQKCAIIFTTNWAPDDLYLNGLQRNRFLGFIFQLKKHWHIVPLAGGQDYRRQALAKEARWLVGLNADNKKIFSGWWHSLLGGTLETPHNLALPDGRFWPLKHTGQRAVWLDANTMLAEPRGIADFLVLAENFDVVFLDNLNGFKPDQNERAKRLMLLVDALYDMGTILAVHSAAELANLYPPQGSLAFEFSRTTSRLSAMCAQNNS